MAGLALARLLILVVATTAVQPPSRCTRPSQQASAEEEEPCLLDTCFQRCLAAGCPRADVEDSGDGLFFEEVADGTEPGDSEPGDSEPGDSEPGDSEPGDSEPGDSEPGDSEPGDSEPGDSEPGDSEPGDSEPGDSEPGDSEPGDSEPRGGGQEDGSGSCFSACYANCTLRDCGAGACLCPAFSAAANEPFCRAVCDASCQRGTCSALGECRCDDHLSPAPGQRFHCRRERCPAPPGASWPARTACRQRCQRVGCNGVCDSLGACRCPHGQQRGSDGLCVTLGLGSWWKSWLRWETALAGIAALAVVTAATWALPRCPCRRRRDQQQARSTLDLRWISKTTEPPRPDSEEPEYCHIERNCDSLYDDVNVCEERGLRVPSQPPPPPPTHPTHQQTARVLPWN